MLIDLLSTSNYVSFNIRVAQVFGLHSAIYISELLNINDKAIRKNKIDNSVFKLDRKYIEERTTITVEEQLNIEKNLIKLGLIEKPSDSKDDIIVNVTTLTTLLMSEDEELLDNVRTLEKLKKNTSGKKKTKAETERESLKSCINVSNQELYDAYCEWIDAVYAKLGWMSKKAVLVGQQMIDETSNRNLDVALKILEIATVNGYKDMTWAVKTFKDNFELQYKVQSRPNVSTPRKGLSSEEF